MFCEKCGKQLPDNAAFCDGCGARIDAPAPNQTPQASDAAPAAAGTAAAAVKPKNPLSTLNRKTLIGIAAAVVVVILAIVLIVALVGGNDAPLLYVTDGELVHRPNPNNEETFVVNDEFVNSDLRMYMSDANAAQGMAVEAGFTQDYEKFVYLADYEADSEEMSLFWIEAKDLDKTDAADRVVEVASGVTSSLTFAADADLVLYQRDDRLYYYNFSNDAELVSRDVYTYSVSDDGEYIVYLTREDDGYDLYVYNVSSGEEERIDSEVFTVYFYDRDNGFANMIYSTDNGDGTYDVYRGGLGTDAEKLFSDAYTVLSAYGDNVFYVETDGYDASLYLYNAENDEKTELSSSYSYSAYTSARYGVIVYSEYDDDKLVWFSSVNGGEPVEMDNPITTGAISSNGETLYLIALEDGADDDEGELFRYTVDDQVLSDGTSLDKDVYAHFLRQINGEIYFMVDYDSDNYTGTLCVWDDETIELADEVYEYRVYAYGDDGAAFFADPDEDSGMFYLYDGREAVRVDSEVYMDNWTEFNGDVLYLTDFDEDDGGSLYLYDGKESTRIANDVQAIIEVN